MSEVSEIAAYMNQNPTLLVGIDGSMDPRGTDPRNQACATVVSAPFVMR